jgi:DNA-binding MarR family transcriptional regulator
MNSSQFADERLTARGLLVEVHDGLFAIMTPDLERQGISPTEFGVLIRLARTPGERLRMTDLASQVGMSTSGLTRLVDRLVRTGLVEREHCPTDRRGAYAVLTTEGRRRARTALRPHLDAIETWFTGVLDDEELEALCRALRKVRDHVRPEATAGAAEASTTSR